MSQPRTSRLTAIKRGLRVTGKLFHGLLLVGLVFSRIRPALREAVIEQWCREMLEILAIRLTRYGEIPPDDVRSVLFVTHHVSWLDLLVLNSLQQVRFVATTDVCRHQVLGWLADKTGTLVLRQTRTDNTGCLATLMQTGLMHEPCLALCTEDPTGIETPLRSRHRSLFDSATTGSSVWPVAIQYWIPKEPQDPTRVAVAEPSFIKSILALLNRPSTKVCLSFAPPVERSGQDYRLLAHECRAAMERQLRTKGTLLPQLPPRPLPAGPLWPPPVSAT